MVRGKQFIRSPIPSLLTTSLLFPIPYPNSLSHIHIPYSLFPYPLFIYPLFHTHTHSDSDYDFALRRRVDRAKSGGRLGGWVVGWLI